MIKKAYSDYEFKRVVVIFLFTRILLVVHPKVPFKKNTIFKPQQNVEDVQLKAKVQLLRLLL